VDCGHFRTIGVFVNGPGAGSHFAAGSPGSCTRLLKKELPVPDSNPFVPAKEH
jgi:hypothetical protein